MKNKPIPDILKKEIKATRDIGSTEFNNGLLKAYKLLSPYIMEWKLFEKAPKNRPIIAYNMDYLEIAVIKYDDTYFNEWHDFSQALF